MKTIFPTWRDAYGEPQIWWHWRNIAADREPGHWPSAGRFHLWFLRNCFSFHWCLFTRGCDIRLECSTTGDENLSFSFSIPFIGSFYFHIDRVPWVKYLPGVAWTGKYGSGERVISIYFHQWAIWWRLWRYGGESKRGDWRESCFHIDDFFLGRAKYQETDTYTEEALIPLPEKNYHATVRLYDVCWKRPRWPWPKVVSRADVKFKVGVLIPGRGEEAWNMEDDAVYEFTCPARTVLEAIHHVTGSILKDRDQDPSWSPTIPEEKS